MRPRHLISLSAEEKRQFLDSFDHVFSDIDGVVWNVSQEIVGSGEGFRQLVEAGKQLTFITNNSVRPESQCVLKLRSHNINVEAARFENVMHPAKCIVEYLKGIGFDGLIYVLASEAFGKVLREAGYKVLEGPNVVLKESFNEVAELVLEPQPVKAVIIDLDLNLSFLKMMKASYYLRQEECLLLAGATDIHLPIARDLKVMGPGPFAKVLQQVSGREVLTFGKPSKVMAELLMQRYNISTPSRVLMVGDMLKQDVHFATSCGFQSLLVLSGGCSYNELMTETDPNFTPDYYAHSVAEFVEFMRDLKHSGA